MTKSSRSSVVLDSLAVGYSLIQSIIFSINHPPDGLFCPHRTSICESSPATITIALMIAALHIPSAFSHAPRSLSSAGPSRQYGNGAAVSTKRSMWAKGESSDVVELDFPEEMSKSARTRSSSAERASTSMHTSSRTDMSALSSENRRSGLDAAKFGISGYRSAGLDDSGVGAV